MTHDSERPLQSLIYDSAADRLRAACRFGGFALLGTALLPFEAVGDQAIFVWEILGELHPASALAALAPMAVGALLLAATFTIARPSLLAFAALLLLSTWSLVATLGADAAAWDVGSLPESLDQRTELATLTIALSGAALRLLAEPAARKAARAVSGAAVLCGASFASWPSDGEAPLQTALRFLGFFATLPDPRLLLGYGLVLAIILFPLIAAAVAASFALAERRDGALSAELVTFGLPGLLFLLAARNVLLTFGDGTVLVLSGFALLLAALLSVTARSLEVAALALVGFRRSSDRERSPKPLRFAAISSAVAIAMIAVVFVLARPRAKGVDWPLTGQSAEADRLFGELLPTWIASRARWSLEAKSSSSAEELAEARAASNELLRAARPLGPDLARAMGELVSASSDLDLAGRRWFHLVEGVNDASRLSKLPYYLDPVVRTARHEQSLERLFLVQPYRIEGVQKARALGGDYALLDVRSLGRARTGHERLGFSRDSQPFALVVLDEIEPYAAALEELARRSPASCADVDDPHPVWIRCGALLRELAPTVDAVRKLVARHELQHQIDGPLLARSRAVLRVLEGFDAAAIDEVNRELSAYLAEFTTHDVSPKLALVHTLPFWFARPRSALSFVSRIKLAALADHESDELAEHELQATFEELAALPDAVLRERARAAYERLYDRAPAEVEHVQ